MARKRGRSKSKGRPQKFKSAFNLKSALFAYLTLNVATQTAFRTNPINFFAGGYLQGYSGGGGSSAQITLKELIGGQTIGGTGMASQDLMLNLQNNLKDNALMGIGSLIGLRVADKVITKFGVSRSFNKTVRSVGMGDLVKM